MKRRRQRRNSSGTIVTLKRKSGTVYTPELTIGWEAGKRQKVRGRIYPTWDEANNALEELKKQHRRGIDLTDRQDLAYFLDDWIDNTFAPANKPKSVTSYRWGARHIKAALGDKPIQRLTGQQIQRFITSLSHAPHKLAPKSVILVHTVLHAALEQAVKWKLITDNPADGITLPRVKKGPVKALDRAQARAFMEAARGEPLELGLRLMLSLGLRRGEVSGLRWCDIDFENGRLYVNGTLTYVEGMGLVWDTTKGNRTRALKLPAKLIASLRWHQTRQNAERIAMEGKWAPKSDDPAHDYVFISPTNGGPLNSNGLYVAFKKVAKLVGLPDHYSPHSLRHSCASFLYAEGVPDKVISTHLGHSSTNITKEIYISLYQDTLDDTAERVERILDDTDDEAEARRAGGEK